jgi:hypothetical protein
MTDAEIINLSTSEWLAMLAHAWELGHLSLCRRHGNLPFDVCQNPYRVTHVHTWQRRQNVTTKGYEMPAYEVCACGDAREVTA